METLWRKIFHTQKVINLESLTRYIHSSALTLCTERLVVKGVHFGCSGTKEAQGSPPTLPTVLVPRVGKMLKCKLKSFLSSAASGRLCVSWRVGWR